VTFPGTPRENLSPAAWQRVRRHALPSWMLERATERRLQGDWRGACAAARVRVTFDDHEARRSLGREGANRLYEDLEHFAPDLVRWHFPRQASTLLGHQIDLRLARYSEIRGLYVSGPYSVEPEFLTLSLRPRFNHDSRAWPFDEAGWAWDVRRVHAFRAHCGGGSRLPFFHKDGTPLSRAEIAQEDPEDDVAELTERLTVLAEHGREAVAWSAVGVTARTAVRRALMFGRAVERARVLAARRGTDMIGLTRGNHGAVCLDVARPQAPCLVTVQSASACESLPFLSPLWWSMPADLQLLRRGLITPADLHPLVRTAVFPALTQPPPDENDARDRGSEAVRVYCAGRWHEVTVGPAGPVTPHPEGHEPSVEEYVHGRRPPGGCQVVVKAWRTGRGRLPAKLRELRRNLLLKVRHGDTPAVTALLDTGLDPRVRCWQGGSLLHELRHLDHDQLLHRLLAAGLDVNQPDSQGDSPLHVAVRGYGTPELVRALIAAGADPHQENQSGKTPAQLARWHRRDLPALVPSRLGPTDAAT